MSTDFASHVLSLEIENHVATLWLDRPDARNACGRDFWNDLPRACGAISEAPDVRCVIVAARGPHFTVGLDLKELGGALTDAPGGTSHAESSARTFRAVKEMQASINAVADLEMPVIAAVHGYCIGAGVDVISACDVRVCSEDAIFSVRETRMAIVADLGTLQRLPGIIGAGHVAELAFTGEDIDARRAERIGLVNSVLEPGADAAYAGARELAERIAANSPLAVRGTKAVLRAGDTRRIDEGLDFVARWNTMYLRSDDLSEAITAFLERRPPHFEGR